MNYLSKQLSTVNYSQTIINISFSPNSRTLYFAWIIVAVIIGEPLRWINLKAFLNWTFKIIKLRQHLVTDHSKCHFIPYLSIIQKYQILAKSCIKPQRLATKSCLHKPFQHLKVKIKCISAYRQRRSLTMVINELSGQFIRHTDPA